MFEKLNRSPDIIEKIKQHTKEIQEAHEKARKKGKEQAEEEKPKKTKVKVREEDTEVIFRIKRKAEIDPLDLLAIENIPNPLKQKKVQTKSIMELLGKMENLTLNPENSNPQPTLAQSQLPKPTLLQSESPTILKPQETKPGTNTFLNGLENYVETEYKKRSLLLMRITETEIDQCHESELRTGYQTVYTQQHAKSKREEALRSKRAPLMGQTWMNKSLRVFDIDIRKDIQEKVLHCNGKPMIYKNLLEVSASSEDRAKEAMYYYYRIKKGDMAIEEHIPKVTLAPGAAEVVGHIYNDEYLDDQAHSDDEKQVDVDEKDSNSENNSNNTYPEDEDIVEKENKKREMEYFDEYAGGYQSESDESDEDKFRDHDDDDDERPKDYYEKEFTRKFASNNKDKIIDEEY